MRVNAVVVAAGQGTRMGGVVPKPFLSLGGRSLILHTLSCFAASQVHRMVLVTAAKDLARCEELIRSDPRLSNLECVLQPGGATRQDSVRRGLMRLDSDCEVVVIHDGVRPFVSSRLIDRCIELAFQEGAVVVGIPVRETVKVVTADRRVQETPPRESLWKVQTPQVFRTEIIREAYDRAEREGTEATDDAMLVERLGMSVVLLEGHRSNIKITVPEDVLFAEALLRAGWVP